MNQLEEQIYEAYEEVLQTTNQLLTLLSQYLNASAFDNARQQNVVRLRVIKELLENSGAKATNARENI